MAEVAKRVPGAFCWAELGTTDLAGAKEFYTHLFEWTPTDYPMGNDCLYTILRHKGLDAAALYGLREEQRKSGVPPHWLLYVQVASADDAAAKAKELGAQVHAGPFDVPGQGRMAVVQDPQGAMFAVWQPAQHPGSLNGEVNYRHCWSELATTDIAGAREFYTKLFGWTVHAQPMGAMEYTVWMNQGSQAGGGIQMDEQWQGIPPHWMVYFSVPSIEGSVKTASERGGSVKVPPTEVPGVGRFSVVADPQGAVFSMIELKM